MSDFIQGGKKLIHFDPSRVDELAAIKRIVAYSWDGLIIIPATHSPFYPVTFIVSINWPN